MSAPPPFDAEYAHRRLSAECFNEVWELIDRPHRTPEENQAMVNAALASVYHWTKRPDCTPQNLSVGYWQVSRVHALLRRGPEAHFYAKLAESYSLGLPPFFKGYALEAVARAAAVQDDEVRCREALAEARVQLALIENPQERDILKADLDSFETANDGFVDEAGEV